MPHTQPSFEALRRLANFSGRLSAALIPPIGADTSEVAKEFRKQLHKPGQTLTNLDEKTSDITEDDLNEQVGKLVATIAAIRSSNDLPHWFHAAFPERPWSEFIALHLTLDTSVSKS